MSAPPRDPWFRFARWTPARIGLGRAGVSLPTREVLAFALAHAQARDAVHARLDRDMLRATLTALGLVVADVESMARDRQVYLRRPDLGRRLSDRSRLVLSGIAGRCDLAIVIADGLSATAVQAHAGVLLAAFLPFAARLELKLAPVVIAEGARVALGDEIGERLGARVVAVLIGERPGLTAADSLSIYLTFAPCSARHDGERNCISNVRPDGLPPEAAAARLAWLVDAALMRKMTGIGLKDESDMSLTHELGPILPGK